jgi:hypothetical protein
VGVLAEILPRRIALALGVRRLTPAGCSWPRRSVEVAPIDADTGGAFRAAWRMQDPAVDPREPNGGESSSTGNDHGWSGCTCTAGALVIAYQSPQGGLALWGGDLRHKQGDLSGGTDLYDIRTAWAAYGETLNIRSGAGWSAVVAAHEERRAIVIQGTGNVPGSESFDGGHACAIAPETHADGRWLFGDPLASGWQWIDPGAIRSWAERWQSSIAFATGEKPSTSSSPSPPSTPLPPVVIVPDIGAELRRAEGYAAELARDGEVSAWIDYLGPDGPIASGVWDASTWAGGELASVAWLLDGCDDPSAVWGRGPIPDPAAAARLALDRVATWDREGWRALRWE